MNKFLKIIKYIFLPLLLACCMFQIMVWVSYGYLQLLRDDPKFFAKSMMSNIQDYDTAGFFDNYYFDHNYNWNEGVSFKYFLLKKDSSFIETFINDFKYIDGYVYYTVVDGAWPEPDCYFNPKLQLKRINLGNNQIETIDPVGYKEIYQQLNKLSQHDIKWLESINNKCSAKGFFK